MKGKQKFVLEHGTHRIQANTTIPILVSKNGQPVNAFTPGTGKAVLRNFEGTIELDPSDAKTEYGFEIKSSLYPRTEKLDQEPPPQPPEHPNWLYQIRERAKLSMGIIREEFAEQGRTVYEIPDSEVQEVLDKASSQAPTHEAEPAADPAPADDAPPPDPKAE